eukprot:29282-Pelagococcus_subviridis.AAC.8
MRLRGGSRRFLLSPTRETLSLLVRRRARHLAAAPEARARTPERSSQAPPRHGARDDRPEDVPPVLLDPSPRARDERERAQLHRGAAHDLLRFDVRRSVRVSPPPPVADASTPERGATASANDGARVSAGEEEKTRARPPGGGGGGGGGAL